MSILSGKQGDRLQQHLARTSVSNNILLQHNVTAAGQLPESVQICANLEGKHVHNLYTFACYHSYSQTSGLVTTIDWPLLCCRQPPQQGSPSLGCPLLLWPTLADLMHPHYCELLAHLIHPCWTLRTLCWPDTLQPSLPLQVFLQASNQSYRSSSERGVLLCFYTTTLAPSKSHQQAPPLPIASV